MVLNRVFCEVHQEKWVVLVESLFFCLLFLPLRTVKLPEELQRWVGVWAFVSLRSDCDCVLGQCCVCLPSLQNGLSPS